MSTALTASGSKEEVGLEERAKGVEEEVELFYKEKSQRDNYLQYHLI